MAIHPGSRPAPFFHCFAGIDPQRKPAEHSRIGFPQW